MSVKPTNIPTCHLRKSADSTGTSSRHGKLGEVTDNIRTFALPFESSPYTSKMSFEYDSFNRMQQMTYPDGEVVSYGYNLGGMLNDIKGDKNGQTYPYVNHIAYNQYELKDSVLYGNGTLATYGYDVLMRLKMLQSYTGTSPAELMQDIYYDYDAVSNITRIDNQAPALSYGIGGIYTNDYSYDNLYRLSSANGSWDNGAMINTFDLGMSYHQNGRIAVKQLRADILDHLGNITTKDYDNLYSYPDGRNTLEQVEDRTDGSPLNTFEWDNAGNMTMHRLHDECTRRLCWDEENRLQGVADCSYASLYQYDANGERTYKLTGQYSYQNINGRYYPYAVLDNPTLYASPYVVCTPKDYTKHYYAESERVASKIGNGCLRDLCKSLNTDADFNREDEPENPYFIDCGDDNDTLKNKMERNYLLGKKIMECTSANNINIGSKLENLYERIGCINEKEKECYWYHPDHLGSSSWITEVGGKPIQHLHYLPWGEDFVDQRSSTFDGVRYTFSAKEKDAETGYSYFGSRYYNSDLSIWLSVDPQAAKYPSLSPYVYCADNPVKLVDPNGEEVVIILGEYMKESDRQQALNDLRNAAPNLNLELVGDKLVVGDGGTAKTKYEEKLLGGISSSRYKSEVTLELNETAGSYMGADLVDGQYGSKNSVNPYKMKEIENETGSVRGCGLMHEITEGFEMGKIAEREKLTHIDKAWRNPGEMTIGERSFPNDEVGPQHHLYEEGHSLATPQPGDWKAKPKRFFK